MEIFLFLLIIVVLYFVLKSYFIKYDTIIAFTGGLGSGKSFLSVKLAIKLLKRQIRKVKWKNTINFIKCKIKKTNFEPLPIPQLYTNIPVFINKKQGFSIELTEEHLLLRKKIIPRSVVFIDEIGAYASQFEYNNKNISDNFDEFIRLFRHYTLGGYLVVNDQCSENIVLTVRRRLNTVNNLFYFRVWFKLIWTVRVRNISISEEIKTIEENDKEDNMSKMWGFMPLFKRYDTFCYSERYRTVPLIDEKNHKQYKRYQLMKVSSIKINKLTTDEEPIFDKEAISDDIATQT